MDQMPNVLTAQDIANYLRISRKRVYELFDLAPEQGGIRNFSVGRSRRAEKADFKKWLEERKMTRTG